MILYSAYYSGNHPFDMLNRITGVVKVTHPDELKEQGILVIWGGEDISPSLYKKPVSSFTGAGPYASRRDAVEAGLAKRAIELGMPIIGVCRGAQLLCALAGGHLIQHVNNHGGNHVVKTSVGKDIKVNSIHHQMMYPFNVKHELRAWLEHHRSDVHIDVNERGDEFNNKPPVEPEYVYFPDVKGFAVQWHPEMMSPDSPANQYILNDIETQLGWGS